MEPVMNDVCDVGARKGPGNIVIGVMLVVTGVVIMLDRSGALTLRNHWTVWPIILGGIGLARFLQSIPGEPKQGLLLMTAAVWLFLAEAGWVSIGDSWPIVIIALGVIVALNGGRRRRWHGLTPSHVPGERPHYRGPRRPDYPLSPLAAVGIWIAIFVGFQVSGFRSLNGESVSDRIGLVSVMGRSEHVSRATDFQGANVTNVMGRSELDLTRATLAPGATADVSLFSAMGSVVLRVPPTWTVDTGAVTALGKIADDRGTLPKAEADAVPAPRLVLRGLVLFGRVTITP
jgi:cell wall-active antibiotic response 4TMS protein YvqF